MLIRQILQQRITKITFYKEHQNKVSVLQCSCVVLFCTLLSGLSETDMSCSTVFINSW